MKSSHRNTIRLLASVLIVSIGALGYLEYEDFALKNHIRVFETLLTQTKSELAATKQTLDNTTIEKNILEQQLTDEKNRVDSLARQVADIQGTVGILEKIRRTDPELLKKYSKVYFLNENYAPLRLTAIDEKYLYSPKKEQSFHADVRPFLYGLLEAAAQAGIDIKILSAFRSFYEQAGIKSVYNVIYGAGTANQFSAAQGYSEHQLGTTIDFTNASSGATLASFEKTKTYVWLKENAYKYGFILSYPENNDYYLFEPWHWRFVSRALANKLHQENKHFYDLDQREIDTYLALFFD